MIIYTNPAFYLLLASLTAFILLILPTFSVPLLSTFYFLHSTEANGVRFGMYGWCLDEGGICSSVRLGYTWEPQLAVPISSALVLYPISAVFVFCTMITLLPVLYARSARSDKIFAISAWISFAVSFLAFLFMIGMWGVAKSRFEKQGFGASYGNLPWMSLVASLLLLVVALSPYFLGPPPKEKPRPDAIRRRYQTADLEAHRSTRPKPHSSTRNTEKR
ncbi:hypothetical protein M413DRAFT_446815 [Hebeloma cylindrosporum]|uniref:Pali-domain-containing protein n=1 Tax=Hebeloma cylindrosporum TaxID=76867 RepID=A0A0C3C8H7_HEBCY|nr:hypothetical protein M413DRAFT_446815 [Hebeloma cylindrosporum h7]